MANDKRDILRKAAIAKFEADEGLKPNGDDVIARADRMSMIAFGRGFDAGHAAATAEGIPQSDGWVAIETGLPDDSGWYCVTTSDELNYDENTVENMFFHSSLDEWEINSNVRNVIAWQPLPAPYQRQSSEGDSK